MNKYNKIKIVNTVIRNIQVILFTKVMTKIYLMIIWINIVIQLNYKHKILIIKVMTIKDKIDLLVMWKIIKV